SKEDEDMRSRGFETDMSHRGWRGAAALTLGILLLPVSLQAQDYPARDIRAICNFPAGSGADVFVRYFSEKLMEENFRRSMVLSASDPLIFVSRPLSLVLLA